MSYKTVTNCRVCGFSNLKPLIDLGRIPLVNSLPNHPKDVEKYPLNVLRCEVCGLTQLGIVVDPNILYSDYPYESSVSKTFKDHCRRLAAHLKKTYSFKNNPPTVTDIASNDGCLLKEFQEEGFIPRGVEPCRRIAEKCMQDYKIPVRIGFFDEVLSHSARSWCGEDIITATNIFAHVDNLGSFLRGVNYQFEYNRKGILVIEVPYLKSLLENTQFDTIYHEHLSYFHLRPIKTILSAHGLRVFKVEKIHIHGGSIRVYASQHEYPIEYSVIKMEDEETYLTNEVYDSFKHNVLSIKEDLWKLLSSLRDQGKKVYAYGASAKSCVLLNYCGITSEQIYFCVDETVGKIGKYIPGVNIPIVSFNHFNDKPDYILLTAWNFKDELIAKTRHIGAKYIVPVPKVEVI